MSETTWTVDWDNPDHGGRRWWTVTRPNEPYIEVRSIDDAKAQALAERIARLLAEEDEHIEREAMKARCQSEWKSTAKYQDGAIFDAWFAWERAMVRDDHSLDELRTLEAAYRATLPQEPDLR